MDHPLRKFPTAEALHLVNTGPWGPELHTYRYFNLGLDLSLRAHGQGEMEETAKSCGFLKSKTSKFSVRGHS